MNLKTWTLLHKKAEVKFCIRQGANDWHRLQKDAGRYKSNVNEEGSKLEASKALQCQHDMEWPIIHYYRKTHISNHARCSENHTNVRAQKLKNVVLNMAHYNGTVWRHRKKFNVNAHQNVLWPYDFKPSLMCHCRSIYWATCTCTNLTRFGGVYYE